MKRFLFNCVFLTIILLLWSIDKNCYGQRIGEKSVIDYNISVNKTLIIKFKSLSPGSSSDNTSIITVKDLEENKKVKFVKKYGITNVKARIAKKTPSPFNNIYKLQLDENENKREWLRYLKSFKNVVYVEPEIKYELLYIPNDPEAIPVTGKQNYLDIIQAYDAWEFEKGTSSILVGVIDTGIDTAHIDLKSNYWKNTDDPINGIDDDNDGFIDNYYGWDFADNDFDVSADIDGHGTSVTGVSSADTDNGIGIAGVGFNTSFLPLKIFKSSDNEFNNGFEAILHAAEKGCKVIILSWGSADSYSQYAQDIINYIVNEMDVVVVAAAGNTPGDMDFYPASYENVLSVGAVTSGDEITEWASYSNYIDVMAQGTEVYSSVNGDQYGYQLGSSFSAPQAAGVAALIRSRYPDWTAGQVIEQIRVTADDIYDVGSNNAYFEKMGKGRINALNALTDTSAISVRAINFSISNESASYILAGDTIIISFDFINYLNPVNDVNISLSSESDFGTIISDDFFLPSLNMLDTIINSNFYFKIALSSNLPPNEKLKFRLGYSSDIYNDYQYFEFFSSGQYVNLDNNQLKLTIGDNGTLGYYDDEYEEGIGFTVDDKKILDYLGLIVSQNKSVVLDNAIVDYGGRLRTNDFASLSNMYSEKTTLATYDLRSFFSSDSVSIQKINIDIRQKTLTFESAPYIITEYQIINNTDSSLTNVHVGLYADFDLGVKNENKVFWDAINSIGNVHDQLKENYAAIYPIGGDSFAFHAVDVGNENGNVSELEGFLSDSVKHQFLAAGVSKESAGELGSGNDVAVASGIKLNNIAPKSVEKIAFIIITATDSSSLISDLNEAKDLYQVYLSSPAITDRYEICPGNDVIINPQNGDLFEFYSDPFNVNLIATDSSLTLNNVLSDTSIYIVNVDNEVKSDVGQVSVKTVSPLADFEFLPDSIILTENETVEVQFIDKSTPAEIWVWDFGNGYQSSVRNPSILYDNSGNYLVSLTIENELGCMETKEKSIYLYSKGIIPDIGDTSVCMGQPVLLSAENTDSISVYKVNDLINPIYTGNEFVSEPLFEDTLFYISNRSKEIESEPVEVQITISHPQGSINVMPDTTNILLLEHALIFTQPYSQYQYNWDIDDISVSSEPQFSYDFAGQDSFQINLKLFDEQGCMDSLERVIIPSHSPSPSIAPQFICSDSMTVIQDNNRATIIVYEDQGRDSILYKGKLYLTPSLKTSRKYFITGIDSLLESELVEMEITISNNPSIIDMNPDTLNLLESNRVEFESLGTESKRLWEFEMLGSDSTSNTYRDYFDLGRYGVKLSTWDSLGCFSYAVDTVTVLSITSLKLLENRGITVYPNPGQDQLTIEKIGGNSTIEIEIYNLKGKQVFSEKMQNSGGTFIIQTNNLQKGLYVLKVGIGGEFIFSEKIIIN